VKRSSFALAGMEPGSRALAWAGMSRIIRHRTLHVTGTTCWPRMKKGRGWGRAGETQELRVEGIVNGREEIGAARQMVKKSG